MDQNQILEELRNKKSLFEFYQSLSEEQQIFIFCYSFKQMKFKDIEKVLKCFSQLMSYKDVSRLYDECKKYCTDIQKIRDKFNPERKNVFNDFEDFYCWFKSKEDSCGYCGISQDKLYKLFDDKLPLNGKIKRSSGTLEIERLNSAGDYSKENIILACPLCNNAKSNLIDEDSWREIFVEPMKRYYDKLLNRSYGNCVKCGKLATHMHNVHNSWISNPHSEYVPLCDNCWHH